MSCEANGGQEQHLAEYTSGWDLHFDPFFRCDDCGWVEGGDGSSESTKKARIAAHQNLPADAHARMIETHQRLLAGTLFSRDNIGGIITHSSDGSSPNGQEPSTLASEAATSQV